MQRWFIDSLPSSYTHRLCWSSLLSGLTELQYMRCPSPFLELSYCHCCASRLLRLSSCCFPRWNSVSRSPFEVRSSSLPLLLFLLLLLFFRPRNSLPGLSIFRCKSPRFEPKRNALFYSFFSSSPSTPSSSSSTFFFELGSCEVGAGQREGKGASFVAHFCKFALCLFATHSSNAAAQYESFATYLSCGRLCTPACSFFSLYHSHSHSHSHSLYVFISLTFSLSLSVYVE